MCWELIRTAARVVEADLPTWPQLVDQYHEWQVALTLGRTSSPLTDIVTDIFVSKVMREYIKVVVGMTEGSADFYA